MRKFVLSALACVAFAGSSLAANSNLVENINISELTDENFLVTQNNFIKNDKSFLICSLLFYVYDKGGNLIHEMGATPDASGSGCLGEAINLYKELEAAYPEHIINYTIVNT